MGVGVGVDQGEKTLTQATQAHLATASRRKIAAGSASTRGSGARSSCSPQDCSDILELCINTRNAASEHTPSRRPSASESHLEGRHFSAVSFANLPERSASVDACDGSISAGPMGGEGRGGVVRAGSEARSIADLATHLSGTTGELSDQQAPAHTHHSKRQVGSAELAVYESGQGSSSRQNSFPGAHRNGRWIKHNPVDFKVVESFDSRAAKVDCSEPRFAKSQRSGVGVGAGAFDDLCEVKKAHLSAGSACVSVVGSTSDKECPEQEPHWWRGAVEGDGGVSSNMGSFFPPVYGARGDRGGGVSGASSVTAVSNSDWMHSMRLMLGGCICIYRERQRQRQRQRHRHRQ